MALAQVADAHYRAQQGIARETAKQTQALWGQVNPAAVLESWMTMLPDALALVTAGQLAAARLAMPYLRQVSAEQGSTSLLAGIVNPLAFAGVAADGRDLASLLVQPALLVLRLLAAGAADTQALASGLASLTRIVATGIPDAGRTAVGAGIVANIGFVVYVRMLKAPSCGRCIILAGREYSWSEGFARHPQCDCYHLPIRGDSPEQLLVQSPSEIFASMTPEQQNKAFTNDGAQAIRDGADIGQVVNARRGMRTAGGMSITTEGTTSRGLAGRKLGALQKEQGGRNRRSQIPRITPEQIYADAAGDRAEAIRLLKRFAYIT